MSMYEKYMHDYALECIELKYCYFEGERPINYALECIELKDCYFERPILKL